MADAQLLSSILKNNRNTERPGKIKDRELLHWVRMWAYRCVSLNANAAASVPARLYTTNTTAGRGMRMAGAGRPASARVKAMFRPTSSVTPGHRAKAMVGRPDDLTQIDSHPVLELLKDVNEWSDGFAWRFGVYFDLQVVGHHFTKLTTTGGMPSQMWRMLPHYTEVIKDAQTFVSGFEHGTGEARQVFTPDEVLWFRLFDPMDPWGAVSPLEAWLDTIKASHYIQQFQRDMFERGGAPDYIIENAGAMSEKQQDAFAKRWRQKFGTLWRRVRPIAFLMGEAKLTKITESMRDLEFAQGMDTIRDQIGQAFGVPKSLLTSDDVNRANGRESRDAHFREIWYLVQRVEDILNEQLVQRYGDGLVLIHESPIVGDEVIRIQDRASKLASGWTVDEVRTEDGYEALEAEGSDIPLIASGLVTLESLANPPEPVVDVSEPTPIEDEEPDDEATAKAYQVPVDDEGVVAWKAAGDPEGLPPVRPTSLLATRIALVLKGHALLIGDRVDGLPEGWPVVIDAVMPQAEDEELQSGLIETVRQPIGDELTRSAVAAARAIKPRTPITLDNDRVERYLDDASRRIGQTATDSWRKEIRTELVKGIEAGISAKEIARNIRKVTDRSGYQAERIARTELAFAHTHGVEEGWRQTGLVQGKQWVLSPDPCPVCEAVARQFGDGRGAEGDSTTVALGANFYSVGDSIDLGDGKTYAVNYADLRGPPVHPHCRCTMRAILVDA